MPDRTIVEYFGEQKDCSCGYCKSTTPDKVSTGLWAHFMTVEDYQDLIDRGWRRSGKYCYKPSMKETCCPQYAIRCSADAIVLRKSHRKVIKRMNHFLTFGLGSEDRRSRSKELCVDDEKMCSINDVPNTSVSSVELQNLRNKLNRYADSVMNVECPNEPEQASVSVSYNDSSIQVTSSSNKNAPAITSSSSVALAPPRIKAKVFRRQKRLEKLATQGLPIPDPSKANVAKTLDELLNYFEEDPQKQQHPVHRLQLKLVLASKDCSEFADTFAESFAVYKKYQVTVHRDSPDEVTERGFERFLASSPLYHKNVPIKDHPGYGSFHQQYCLDGRIIAVGVLDILPNCVSSKYFFYDPDYSFLSLGVYSALREIDLVRKLSKLTPCLRNYYMGFYIHSCPKMRYKAQYVPSYLLCPETYVWKPVEFCIPLLDKQKYQRFGDVSELDENSKDIDLNEIPILSKRRVLPYSVYRVLHGTNSEELQFMSAYAKMVGKRCAYRMILCRD